MKLMGNNGAVHNLITEENYMRSWSDIPVSDGYGI